LDTDSLFTHAAHFQYMF